MAILPWERYKALVEAEKYEALIETMEIMSDEELMAAFRQGVQELKEGKGRPWADIYALAKKLARIGLLDSE